ncbi:MAG: HlyD family type I secretion periplasmic adaptor subunit [Proteobacteria bacterium]|nr:HlyD family type I secretion periplasmic adaptor subunit [Pseudomonadota bacterium]
MGSADPTSALKGATKAPVTRPAAPTVLPDAVDFLPDARAIEARALPARPRQLLYALCALVVSAAAWAALSEIDRVVVAGGKLVTTTPHMILQPIETSVIRSIEVRPGQIVAPGEVVAVLDPTFAEADVAALRTRHRSLTGQYERLRAEAGGRSFTAANDGTEQALQLSVYERRREEHAARLTAFDKQFARTQEQITSSRAAQRGLSERLAVLQELEDMRSQLFSREVGSRVQMLEVRKERLAMRDELDRLRSSERELAADAEKLRADRDAFVSEWRRQLADETVTTKRELDSVSESLTKAERRSSLVQLTAPVNAVVLEIANRSLGSVVREAEPILTLVPLDSSLEAEVEIAARDIGLIHPGDPVRVKLEAFPFQRHGTLSGEVRTISEDAFARRTDGGGGGEPYYRAYIRLTSTELQAVPARFRLIPGMTATAEITTGKRTVLSYLIYPVIRALDESLREP